MSQITKGSNSVHYVFNYTFNISPELKNKISFIIGLVNKGNKDSYSPTIFFHFTTKNLSELDNLEGVPQERLNWFSLSPSSKPSVDLKKIDHYYGIKKNDEWALSQGYSLLGICCYVYPLKSEYSRFLSPLNHFYSKNWNDSFFLLRPEKELIQDLGYIPQGTKEICLINTEPGDGRVKLRRYFSSRFHDHLLCLATSDENLKHTPYKREGDEGYVYSTPGSGLIPLYIYSTAPNIFFGEILPLPETLRLNSGILSEIERKEDPLNYSSYATAIFELIKKNISNSPFNIGVIGPWVHGKTKLMELIKEKFDEEVKLQDEASSREKATFKDLLRWVKDKDFKINTYSKFYPTVWFNPWKYQSSEQIWAGMGHAIISQLIEKNKAPLEREKIWLKLRLKRIDLIKLRSDLHNYLFGKGLHFFIDIVVLVLIVLGLGALLPILIKEKKLPYESLYLMIPVLYEGVSWVKRFKDKGKKLKSEVEGKYLQYLQEPKYEESLGNYHYLTTDLEKVFDLLIKEKPVIVFIDDLDRCSPKVVAEVFEAINLIMNNPDIKNNCYFILGFDAHIVASALDESYSNFNGQFSGWYFLDKFIQMPFYIPIMNQEEKDYFVSSFFRKEVLAQPLRNNGVDRIKEELMKEFDKIHEQGDEVAVQHFFEEKRDLEEKKILSNLFIQKDIQKNTEDSPEILEQLQYLMNYLNQSPRSLSDLE